jgi:hypothetical protein
MSNAQTSPQQQLNNDGQDLTATEVSVDRVLSKLTGASSVDVINATYPTDNFPNSAISLLDSVGGPTNLATVSDQDLEVPAVQASPVVVTASRDYTPIVVLIILALGAIAIMGRG